MHILIVEDDPLICRELKILLENALYRVTVSESYTQIPEQVFMERPDLVLLDVNLPHMSGFEVCTQIREKMDVPVIFLTSRTDSMDELTGMLKGGDDYITKPYQAPILLARIAAVLKRTKAAYAEEHVLPVCKNIKLDMAKCCLICQIPKNHAESGYGIGQSCAETGCGIGQSCAETEYGDDQDCGERKYSFNKGLIAGECSMEADNGCKEYFSGGVDEHNQNISIELTKNEMKILFVLFSHAGEYVSRMDLIEYLWENQIFIDDNALSVHIARIRDKLKAVGINDFIETKRGIGYRI